MNGLIEFIIRFGAGVGLFWSLLLGQLEEGRYWIPPGNGNPPPCVMVQRGDELVKACF